MWISLAVRKLGSGAGARYATFHHHCEPPILTVRSLRPATLSDRVVKKLATVKTLITIVVAMVAASTAADMRRNRRGLSSAGRVRSGRRRHNAPISATITSIHTSEQAT